MHENRDYPLRVLYFLLLRPFRRVPRALMYHITDNRVYSVDNVAPGAALQCLLQATRVLAASQVQNGTFVHTWYPATLRRLLIFNEKRVTQDDA